MWFADTDAAGRACLFVCAERLRFAGRHLTGRDEKSCEDAGGDSLVGHALFSFFMFRVWCGVRDRSTHGSQIEVEIDTTGTRRLLRVPRLG